MQHSRTVSLLLAGLVSGWIPIASTFAHGPEGAGAPGADYCQGRETAGEYSRVHGKHKSHWGHESRNSQGRHRHHQHHRFDHHHHHGQRYPHSQGHVILRFAPHMGPFDLILRGIVPLHGHRHPVHGHDGRDDFHRERGRQHKRL